jgi:hypothetical protein
MKIVILALSVCMLAVPVLSKQMEPNVELIEGDNRIDIMISGKLFTSYVYGSELTKPVLAPAHTPSGIEANRRHPLGKTPPRGQGIPSDGVNDLSSIFGNPPSCLGEVVTSYQSQYAPCFFLRR